MLKLLDDVGGMGGVDAIGIGGGHNVERISGKQVCMQGCHPPEWVILCMAAHRKMVDDMHVRTAVG